MKGSTLVLVAVAAGLSAAPAHAAPVSRATAVDRAQAAVGTHAAAVRSGPGQAFGVRDVVTDADGSTHVRFTRTYRGLRVLGGDMVVHQGPASGFRGASLTIDRAPSGAITPAISASRAAELGGADAGSTPELVIDARDGTPRLAWQVTVTGTQPDGTPSLQKRTIDARTGRLLVSDETIQTAADDVSLYVGTVDLAASGSGTSYRLADASRGNSTTGDTGNRTDSCGVFSCTYASAPVFTDADNRWGDGTFANRQSAAVDVAYGSAQTWDYYAATFGRIGIAGNGKGAQSRVHYGSRYNNAFWDDACFCMTYGDGDGVQFNPLVGLDVTGHEMSHGVTSHTANLTYSGESGGLNEANSDIFGTMVEFYANNPQDPGDYTIGEEVVPKGQPPLRYMDQPSKDGASADCWSTRVGRLDVHYSSGVGNHFFYFLAHGSDASHPRCGTAGPVTGIGNDAAQRIWYRALTLYMTSSTKYAGARTATLNAARDLYGTSSPQYASTAAAWTAVNVK